MTRSVAALLEDPRTPFIRRLVKGEEARLVDVEESLEQAIARAHELASTSMVRHRVVRARTPGHWSVWRLNSQPAGHCGECGLPYRAKPCGPVHFVVASKQGIVR